ncbi:MAG: bifunctional sugar-1-phosphate nucleotidylyltransferase/acetyltransferase [Candidatus Heimdallarchaeaceae archaeon]
MKVVILAAGEGTRLQPLTSNTPKPLLKILGTPILKRLIDSFLKNSVNSFVIVTNYLEENIKEYISETFPSLDISYVHQEEIKGTGNAFLLAESQIQDDFFLGVYGDCLYSESLIKKSVSAAKKGILSVGGKFTTETESFGIIVEESEGIPQTIIEKPSKEEISQGYANIGIYSLSKEIFKVLHNQEDNKNMSPRGEYEIPDAVNVLLGNNQYSKQLIKLEENDYWFDLGRPWSLLDATEVLLSQMEQKIEGTVEEGVQIKGKIVLHKDAILRSGTYVEGPAFFDEGADIGPNCYIRKFSYFGKKSRVGNGCEVKNSVLGDNTHAAHLSYIGDSILDDNCNFGAGTITANLRLDKGSIPVTIKGKREDSRRRKLGVIIGEGVETGIGVLLMPGIKIGQGSWIGAGTIVNENIPENSMFYGTQKYTLKRKKNDTD